MSAIVVSTKLKYGLSRDLLVDRGVFYSLDEAFEWLRPGQADRVLAESLQVEATRHADQDRT